MCTQEDGGGGVQDRCACKETDPVCGSDNTTYSNVCQLNEAAAQLGYNGTQLWMQYRGPCQSGKYQFIRYTHTHTHTHTHTRVDVEHYIIDVVLTSERSLGNVLIRFRSLDIGTYVSRVLGVFRDTFGVRLNTHTPYTNLSSNGFKYII